MNFINISLLRYKKYYTAFIPLLVTGALPNYFCRYLSFVPLYRAGIITAKKVNSNLIYKIRIDSTMYCKLKIL